MIESCHFIREQLADCSEIDAELDRLNEEAAVVAEMVRTCIQEKATATQTQADFAKKYDGLVSRHETITAEIECFTAEKEKRQCRDRELRIFIKALKSQPDAMTEWNDRPWLALLDHAKVCADGKIVFAFRDGTEIEV